MPIPNAYERQQQRLRMSGIVGNRYAPGTGNVATYPPGVSYGPPQGGQTLDWNQQQLLLAQREREQMLPIMAKLQEGREQRDLDWATTAARLNQDWETGGRELEFRAGQADLDRMFREALQDKEFAFRAREAAAGRGHEITMADIQDALARRRMAQQHQYGLEEIGVQQQFTGSENQLNRMQQERLQRLGHDQTLSRDQILAELREDAAVSDFGRTGQRDERLFDQQRDMQNLGHTQYLDRMGVGHEQSLERDKLGFDQQLEQMRYSDELATGRFERTTESGFLVEQEGQLQGLMQQLGQMSDRLKPEGKAAWNEAKAKLHEIDAGFNAGKFTSDERLRARNPVLRFLQQQNWGEWIAESGTLPGDTVKEGGQVFRLGADGSRERVGPDYEMRSTPEGRKKYEAMIAPIALRDEYGKVIGYEVEGGRGREILPATSGKGSEAGAASTSWPGRFFGEKELAPTIENVRAELRESRGWYDTQAAVKFGVLEQAEYRGPVDWATEMAPHEINEVMKQQAHSIRQYLIAQLSPYQEKGPNGQPVTKPGSPVTLADGTVIRPEAIDLVRQQIPDWRLLQDNQQTGWVKPLPPGLFDAQRRQQQGAQQQGQQQPGQPQAGAFQSAGQALGGIVGGMFGGQGGQQGPQSHPHQPARQQSSSQQGIVPPGQYRRIDGNMGMAGLDPQTGGWQAAVAATGARQVPVKSIGNQQIPVLDSDIVMKMELNGQLPNFPYYIRWSNGEIQNRNGAPEEPQKPRSGYDPYTDVGTHY